MPSSLLAGEASSGTGTEPQPAGQANQTMDTRVHLLATAGYNIERATGAVQPLDNEACEYLRTVKGVSMVTG